MPPVVVSPDSFKGTLGAAEVAEAIAAGLEEVGWRADRCPVADGGEGTLEVLREARGGAVLEADAHDPLGRSLRARFALLGDGRTALVEAAAASGLGLLAEGERDPEAASAAELVAGAAYVLDGVGFDARMLGARAVVTGEGRLDEQTLAGKAAGEVAVRCRQHGVPCHAIVGRRAIDAFQQRMLDLSSIDEAGDPAELRAAGRRLGERLRSP